MIQSMSADAVRQGGHSLQWSLRTSWKHFSMSWIVTSISFLTKDNGLSIANLLVAERITRTFVCEDQWEQYNIAIIYLLISEVKFCVLFSLDIFTEVLIRTLIGSTAFVIGPKQQLRMMLDDARIYATAIYGGCVIVALVCALLVSLLD